MHGSQPTVAWPSNDCRVNVQRIISKFFRIAWNVEKTLFDSRSTVAWTQTTVAWPFSDFFQKFCKRLETSKKRCLTVSRRSRDLRPLSRDGSAILSNFSELLDTSKKRYLTVVQQSRDLRPLSRDRSVTFFKKFPNSLKRLKTLFDCHPTVAWPPTTVAWPSVTFFKIFPNCLKRLKNVVWQSSNGRVTSDHCRVTFSDFFRNFSELLETSKKRCLTVIQRSRDLRPLSRDLQWLFSKFFRIAWNVKKTLIDSHTTVALPPTTVAWPSVTFFNEFPNSLKRLKTLFDSHPTVAWPPTTVAWPSVIFSKFPRIAWNV